MATDSTEEQDLEILDEEVDEETQDETEVEEVEESEAEESEETEESEDEPVFNKRFTQIKGDNPEEYQKNLEDTYAKSSTEAVRLNRENKELKAQLAAAQANPDAQAPVTTEQPVNPALAFAEAEMNRIWEADYTTFVGEHPEVETDPALAEQLDDTLKIVREVVWKQEKRQVGMAEALNKAWKLLDRDDPQEKVRVAAKAVATSSKSSTSTKSEGKAKFTNEQISTYMEMANVDRPTAIKSLSEYATT